MAQTIAEKLEQTGAAKTVRVASAPQTEQSASMPEPPSLKKKNGGNSPDHQIMRQEQVNSGESRATSHEQEREEGVKEILREEELPEKR